MRYFSLFLVLWTFVSADECADLCIQHLDEKACKKAGTYCKNAHACHGLMWTADRRVCIHGQPGCSSDRPVLCEDARQTAVRERPVIMDPMYVRAYIDEFHRCKAGLIPRDTSKVLDPYIFVERVGKFGVEGFSKELVVKRELGQGMYGKAFSFYHTQAVLLKGAKSGHGKDDLCWERSMLRVLSRAVRGIPRVHKIHWCEPLDLQDLFRNRVIIMDRVGDMEWGEFRHKLDRHYRTRLLNLLDTIEQVHATGFIHDDIKGANIRINSSNPNEVILIDFGQARPFIDEEGRHSLDPGASRAIDMRKFLGTIHESFPDCDRFAAIAHHINNLGHDARPDYGFVRAELMRVLH